MSRTKAELKAERDEARRVNEGLVEDLATSATRLRTAGELARWLLREHNICECPGCRLAAQVFGARVAAKGELVVDEQLELGEAGRA